mmetsp:Transcript_16506/g.30220  ORF Transcript_16506/g.30220 Transcript_16506/m.30220 type:complete len:438 (+) Transcript_16506:1477-2790(+)
MKKALIIGSRAWAKAIATLCFGPALEDCAPSVIEETFASVGDAAASSSGATCASVANVHSVFELPLRIPSSSSSEAETALRHAESDFHKESSRTPAQSSSSTSGESVKLRTVFNTLRSFSSFEDELNAMVFPVKLSSSSASASRRTCSATRSSTARDPSVSAARQSSCSNLLRFLGTLARCCTTVVAFENVALVHESKVSTFASCLRYSASTSRSGTSTTSCSGFSFFASFPLPFFFSFSFSLAATWVSLSSSMLLVFPSSLASFVVDLSSVPSSSPSVFGSGRFARGFTITFNRSTTRVRWRVLSENSRSFNRSSKVSRHPCSEPSGNTSTSSSCELSVNESASRCKLTRLLLLARKIKRSKVRLATNGGDRVSTEPSGAVKLLEVVVLGASASSLSTGHPSILEGNSFPLGSRGARIVKSAFTTRARLFGCAQML